MDLIWNNHYNSSSVPSEKKVGSFWWKDFLKYINKYKELATIIVGDGRSVNLWYDKWDNKIQNAVPQIVLLCHQQRHHTQASKNDLAPARLFHLPLSTEAFLQYLLFEETLQSHQVSPSHDVWTYTRRNPTSRRKKYQVPVGCATCTLEIHQDVEDEMSTEPKAIPLGAPKWSFEHKIHAQKEVYGAGLVYMRELYHTTRRNYTTPLPKVHFVKQWW